MGDKTGIEWTDATWNPVTGCTKVSQGCKFCYAERLFPRAYPGRKFTEVRCHPERLDQPLRWAKPRRIFVNSMSDLFHEDVPEDFLTRVFATMFYAARHRFQVLTKRPGRMRAFMASEAVRDGVLNWPPANVWLGVSVEDQATADERIPLLLQTPAAVRFVSYEPALGLVDFTSIPRSDHEHPHPSYYDMVDIDWIIAGVESGPNARPSHPNWFRSVRDQCAAAGVPYFFKQWGEWAPADALPDGSADRYDPRGGCLGDLRIYRFGKVRAGHVLDGKVHQEWPA